MIPILRGIFQTSLVMHRFSSNLCWAEGNLPQLVDLSWPIQAHAATIALIPHCNVPNPPSGEEDATKTIKNLWENSPMNMNMHIN